MKSDTKRRVVNKWEKYVQNPIVKGALHLGVPLPAPWGALLETTGRKTGKPRRNPVIRALVDNQLWLAAEHGHKSGWVKNVKANPRVRVKLHRRWRTGVAHILDDDDCVARARWLAQRLGGWHRLDPLAAPLFWTEPVTVRIDLDDT